MLFLLRFIKIKITDWRTVDLMNLPDLLGPLETQDPAPPSSRIAILWGQDDLFAQAILSFLEAKKTWKVVQIFSEQGIDFLIEQVKRHHPAVVILHLGDRAFDRQLPLQVIQSQPELKVVVVSPENNVIQVFQKQNLMMHEASELLSIIES
jgi:hypothetical protein